ncbi:unnamed protein product [Amoebophrya sp. A25]|nr:unnamed protein product [Amoebophrya sp. A25]|eukprot:GSA25T00017002001.1
MLWLRKSSQGTLGGIYLDYLDVSLPGPLQKESLFSQEPNDEEEPGQSFAWSEVVDPLPGRGDEPPAQLPQEEDTNPIARDAPGSKQEEVEDEDMDVNLTMRHKYLYKRIRSRV